jgi:hypothetical protein
MARELPGEEQAVKQPTQEEIAQRAYQVFVERGRPEGRDLEHWLEAEAQLKLATQQKATSPSARTNRPSTRQQQASRRA